MDFELWYLILVPLLFAAGWFARSFDIKEKQTIANEKDTLYKGVDLLLSNKQDQAIDAFINLVKLDPDTVEMHFSLAGLFRRRGEFDRAIKIHNVLVNREDLPKKIRSRALYELGEDYLKAGLWDRAEECFLKLSDTSESYKTIARKELLHIYETEKEWQKAIDEANIIQRQSGEDQSTRIAQLYCELTQQNLYFKNFKGAAEALEKALKVDPNNKRALIIKGKYKKGEELEAVVLSIDVERERISLGVKQMSGDPFNNFCSTHEKGSVVTGKVKSVEAKGAVIDLGNDTEGYLRASEIGPDRVEDARNVLKEGDEVTAAITNIDRKARSIQLSIRAKDQAETREAMAKMEEDAQAGTTNLGALLRAKLEQNK